VVRLAAVLLATLAIQLTVRGMIPGAPAPVLIAVPLACAAPPVLVFLARRNVSAIARGLITAGLVLHGAVVALFPWGAGQLTQF